MVTGCIWDWVQFRCQITPETPWRDLGIIHNYHQLKVMRKLVLFPYQSLERYFKKFLLWKFVPQASTLILSLCFATLQYASSYFKDCIKVLNSQTKLNVIKVGFHFFLWKLSNIFSSKKKATNLYGPIDPGSTVINKCQILFHLYPPISAPCPPQEYFVANQILCQIILVFFKLYFILECHKNS